MMRKRVVIIKKIARKGQSNLKYIKKEEREVTSDANPPGQAGCEFSILRLTLISPFPPPFFTTYPPLPLPIFSSHLVKRSLQALYDRRLPGGREMGGPRIDAPIWREVWENKGKRKRDRKGENTLV